MGSFWSETIPAKNVGTIPAKNVRTIHKKKWARSMAIVLSTNSGTFHRPKNDNSVDFSGTATRSGSSQHVSMRDVNCKYVQSVLR